MGTEFRYRIMGIGKRRSTSRRIINSEYNACMHLRILYFNAFHPCSRYNARKRSIDYFRRAFVHDDDFFDEGMRTHSRYRVGF